MPFTGKSCVNSERPPVFERWKRRRRTSSWRRSIEARYEWHNGNFDLAPAWRKRGKTRIMPRTAAVPGRDNISFLLVGSLRSIPRSAKGTNRNGKIKRTVMRIRQKGYRERTVVIQPRFLVGTREKNVAKKHANWNYFDDLRFERIEKNIYLRSLNKDFSELSSTNWLV